MPEPTTTLPPKQTFLHEFLEAFAQDKLVKLTLGHVQTRSGVQKLVLAPVVIKGQRRIKAVERFSVRDLTHIFDIEQAGAHVEAVLGSTFRSGNLFSIDADLKIAFNRRGEPHLIRAKPTLAQSVTYEHNRSKNYAIAPDRPFLLGLGVADRDGRIRPTMASKYKQIQKFIELIDSLIKDASIDRNGKLKIVDIGSGKGYLTFALFDFLQSSLASQVTVVGIERRADLVALCNDLVKQLGMDGLSFNAEQASQAELSGADMIMALHACDTATDDAIAQGIREAARLIVCAPCCQHELAPQLKTNASSLQGLLRFGLFKQRQADLVTDTARALLLETMGYRVKVIEFVSTEHTSKNVMLAASLSPNVDRRAAWEQYSELKRTFGFTQFALEVLVSEQIRSVVEKLSSKG